MQTLRVNGYDMAYLEIGAGPPLVCVHGTLGDFRTWSAVLGPLSKQHRVIAVSLRRFFPEHWDGVGDDYQMAQHVADVIAFIEQLERRTGRPDRPFPRRAYWLSRRRAAAGPAAQAGARRARRRPRCFARARRATASAVATLVAGLRPRLENIRSGDIDEALKDFLRWHRWRRCLGAARRPLQAAVARQRLHGSARPARTESPLPRRMRNRSTRRRCSSAAPTPREICLVLRVLAAACCRRQDRDDRGLTITGCSSRRRSSFPRS